MGETSQTERLRALHNGNANSVVRLQDGDLNPSAEVSVSRSSSESTPGGLPDRRTEFKTRHCG